ncbi:MAG: thioredoxin domain-containing protein, partial [Candidatus Binatia bacterium]
FVLGPMARAEGTLDHSYRSGRSNVEGLLEDYAYVADGLIALYEATFEETWLDGALALARAAFDRFGDGLEGGFYTAPADHDLLVRQKEIVESATPAPGAVLALVAQRLAVFTDDPELAKPATDALRVAHVYMDRAPSAVPTWLQSLDFHLSPRKEIAFTGPLESDEGRALLEVVNRRYLPRRVLAARRDGAPSDGIALLRDKPATDRAVAYVCEHYVCAAPTSDPTELARQLG